MNLFERLLEKLKSQGISFAFFVGGVIIGAVVAVSFYFIFARKKRKPVEKGDVLNIDDVIKAAVANFDLGKSGSDYKSKLRALANAAANAAHEVFERYFGTDYKKYEVVKCGGYLENGFYIPLEFTVYELVAYLERIIDDLQIVAEGLLDKKLVKAVYAIGRRAAKIEDKDPRDLRISTVYAKFFGKSADEKEKKEAGAIKKFFLEKLADIGVGVSAAYADGAFKVALERVIYSTGLLCSHSLVCGDPDALVAKENAV